MSDRQLTWKFPLAVALAGLALLVIMPPFVAAWRENKLEPMNNVRVGMTIEDLGNHLGETWSYFRSSDRVREFCRGYNYICREPGLEVPPGIGSWDREHNFFDPAMKKLRPLPDLSDSVAVFRLTILHTILVYLDSESRAERILLCTL